jgi:integrase
MNRRRLTEAGVSRLRPPETGRLSLADAVVTGLWLRVTPNGVKSWSLVYRPRSSKEVRRLTLGKWPGIGVAAARQLAKDALLEVARGKDPARERKLDRTRESDRFEVVAAEFVERELKRRAPRSWELTEATINGKLVPAWTGLRLQEIGKPEVLRLIDAEMDLGYHRSANVTLQLIRRIFAWADERGHEIGGRNPASGIRPPGVERSRDRVLSDAELAAIWRTGDRFAQLLILTTARRSEVGEMRWSEVDLETATWRIPAERCKSGRAHDVPLSPAVVAILEGLPRKGDRVFRAFSFAQRKRALDRASGVAGWRFHDLRRTATSGMAKLGTAPHILSACLNHLDGSTVSVTAIYNRHKYEGEKRRALELWADFVLGLADGSAGKVVPLRA